MLCTFDSLSPSLPLSPFLPLSFSPTPPPISLSLSAVSFQLGSTCSDSNFPIMNYSVVIHQASPSGSEIEEVGRKTYNVTLGEPIPMPAVIDLPQLMQQQQYNVSVEACINITCRNTSSITLSKYSGTLVHIHVHVNVYKITLSGNGWTVWSMEG